MTDSMLEEVRRVELLAANAWPAALEEQLDGWRLRCNAGVTRRANSVWPNGPGGELPLADKLARVKEFYGCRALPPRYQICPAAQPPDLDAVLAGRGYACLARTAVQTADVDTVRARSAAHAPGCASIADRFEERWWTTFYQTERVSPRDADGYRGILRRVRQPTGYALLEVDGEPAALGLGIHEGDWVGIFGMVTRAEYRRRGAATAVLHALATWAHARRAARLYLQVMDDNTGARTLYERVGFATLYHYHYREAPVEM